MRSDVVLVIALSVAALLSSTVQAQSIYSPYPSRTTILALSNSARENATIANHVRTHSGERTVLGFVAPWNPRGTALAERFRGKFDVISPAWHTVDVVHTDGQAFYSVGGGSTGKHDDEWQKRMQSSAKSGDGRDLDPVKIAPRFVLDRFTAEDLLELLQSEPLMQSMATAVFNSVMDNGYDGAVFECAAVWAIDPLVKLMTDKLREQDKTLGVVLPPLKDDQSEETIQTNKITLHGMKVLSPLADFVVVMTYDYSGRAGRAYKDVYDVDVLPDGSPLDKDGVRTSGPNTPLKFLQANIEQLTATLSAESDQFAMGQDSFVNNPFGGSGGGIAGSGKLLAGLPLYGYTYAVGWFDNLVTTQSSVPRVPPTSTLSSKDNDTDAQAAARAKAEKREADTPNVVPLLRFAGEPFKHEDLEAQLRTSKALIRLDEESQEQFFDYVAELPSSIIERQEYIKAQKGEEADANKPEPEKMASYWRAYFPSAHTMRERMRVVQDFPDVGIALWDVGQAGEWLLHLL